MFVIPGGGVGQGATPVEKHYMFNYLNFKPETKHHDFGYVIEMSARIMNAVLGVLMFL